VTWGVSSAGAKNGSWHSARGDALGRWLWPRGWGCFVDHTKSLNLILKGTGTSAKKVHKSDEFVALRNVSGCGNGPKKSLNS
jgi:hypothetical protein